MLSQEELDKLLEEESKDSSDKQEPQQQEKETKTSSDDSSATLDQDELDKLLEADGEQAESSEEADKSESKAKADDEGELDWSQAFEEAAAGGDPAAAKAIKEGELDTQASGHAGQKEQPKASSPEFSDFSKSSTQSHGSEDSRPNLDFIMDLPLDVSVELGRSRLQIRDLLQLAQGSVIELNKMAGEPAEIYVNQKLMAKGEVVVVNEKFGVRLTEIISPADRVKNLG